MAFLRIKKVKGLQYFYLVKNKRDIDGKTRQEIIEYLGAPVAALKRAEELKLPQRMIEKIKSVIPSVEFYALCRVSQLVDGQVIIPRTGKLWTGYLTEAEAAEVIKKLESDRREL